MKTIIFSVAIIFALALAVDGTEHLVNKKHGHGHGHESRSHHAPQQRVHQLKQRHRAVRDGYEPSFPPEELVCPPCNCYNIWEEEVVSDNGESGFDTTVVPPIPPPPPPPPIASESSNPTPPPTSEPPASRKRGRLFKKNHGHSARGHHH